jgi:hypothetical protein
VRGKQSIGSGNLADKEISGINKKDIVVFAFFLLLSFIFWYLNSLENDIETDIRFPVRYIGSPKDRMVVEKSPERLNLNIKGTGYSILKLRLSGNKSPVIIDISKVSYKRVPGSSNTGYYITTSGLEKSLSHQLRSGCEITSIRPDTLFFNFEKTEANPVQSQPGYRIGRNKN